VSFFPSVGVDCRQARPHRPSHKRSGTNKGNAPTSPSLTIPSRLQVVKRKSIRLTWQEMSEENTVKARMSAVRIRLLFQSAQTY
jgi:hypothetical protein